MIGFYSMSLIGSSHLLEKDGICQDSCDVKTLNNGWIVAAIADGLGSAKSSDIGSKMAVSEVLRFVKANIPESWHDDSLCALLSIAYHSALKKIKTQADKDGKPLKDYDTTLTSIIYNGSNVVFGHVGDGGIISLNQFGEFDMLTTAQKGEEFNQVMPLRSGPQNWVFGKSHEPIAALLMLTDGIYDVVCPWLIAKNEQRIHINYVRPLMDKNLLPVNSAADFKKVKKEIQEFLCDSQSRHITDDKTIVGIINTDVTPEIKPQEYYVEPDWKGLLEEHRASLYGCKPPDVESVTKQSILDPKTNISKRKPSIKLSHFLTKKAKNNGD